MASWGFCHQTTLGNLKKYYKENEFGIVEKEGGIIHSSPKLLENRDGETKWSSSPHSKTQKPPYTFSYLGRDTCCTGHVNRADEGSHSTREKPEVSSVG